MIVHSEKYCTWYRKAIWNIQYKFADVRKNDLRDGTRPDSHVAALWTFHIVKNDIYFLPYHYLSLNPRGSHWSLVREELCGNFCLKNFDLVMLNKLTFSLFSCRVSEFKMLTTKHKNHWKSLFEIWPTVGSSSGWQSLMGKVLWSERFCILTMRFAYEAGETLPQNENGIIF